MADLTPDEAKQWREMVELQASIYDAGIRAGMERAAKICETAIPKPVPCPSGIAGCLVMHYADRVPSGTECAIAIRAAMPKPR